MITLSKNILRLLSFSLALLCFPAQAVIHYGAVVESESQRFVLFLDNGIDHLQLPKRFDQQDAFIRKAKENKAYVVAMDDCAYDGERYAQHFKDYDENKKNKLNDQQKGMLRQRFPDSFVHGNVSDALLARCEAQGLKCYNAECRVSTNDPKDRYYRYDKRAEIEMNLYVASLKKSDERLHKIFSDILVLAKNDSNHLVTLRVLEQINKQKDASIIVILFPDYFGTVKNYLTQALNYKLIYESGLQKQTKVSNEDAAKACVRKFHENALDIAQFFKTVDNLFPCPKCSNYFEGLENLKRHFSSCNACKAVTMIDDSNATLHKELKEIVAQHKKLKERFDANKKTMTTNEKNRLLNRVHSLVEWHSSLKAYERKFLDANKAMLREDEQAKEWRHCERERHLDSCYKTGKLYECFRAWNNLTKDAKNKRALENKAEKETAAAKTANGRASAHSDPQSTGQRTIATTNIASTTTPQSTVESTSIDKPSWFASWWPSKWWRTEKSAVVQQPKPAQENTRSTWGGWFKKIAIAAAGTLGLYSVSSWLMGW